MITELVDILFAFAAMLGAVVAMTYGLVMTGVVLDGVRLRHRERSVVREARRVLARDRVRRAHEEHERRRESD